MSDGGYDGGCSDPDYYDLEFRQQNPSIYGDDEYMQEYYGRGGYSYQQRPSAKRRSRAQKDADDQFQNPELLRNETGPSLIKIAKPPGQTEKKYSLFIFFTFLFIWTTD